MKKVNHDRSLERGSAGVKFLLVFLVLAAVGNAGLNYVPVAYQGASFKQEMDTAVVKALGASGRMKPLDIAQATVQKAAVDYEILGDAIIEIKPVNGVINIHAAYSKPVAMLPFGMYTHEYKFDYTAKPVGYLLE